LTNIGDHNAAHGAEAAGFRDLKAVHWNFEAPRLYEEALSRKEAQLARGGAIVATTGSHTGRSPKDKFVVRDAGTENEVWWDNNGAITPEQFETLRQDFLKHAEGRELFAQDLYGGADPAYRVKARVFTEFAWHSLFIRNLLIRPDRSEIASYVPDMTIIDLPSFQADPARHGCRSKTVIAIDFSKKLVLIGGSAYAGEMKKSVFTYLNYILPGQGVMPMHCSANAALDAEGGSAIFFGLSGTGKTTLSNDSSRQLLGDDEHGWSNSGIFNFEGGCYAKTIRLSRNAEPEIYATTERFGTVMENVIIDPVTRVPDFDDASLTENTRCAYPLDFIANASATGRASEEHRDADLRRLRGDAADRQAHRRRGDVPLPLGLHRQGGRHRARPDRAGGDLLDLLRRAVHAAAPEHLRQPAARPHRQAQRRLLAGQHRLDRRRRRHRPADADPRDAPPAERRPRRLAGAGRVPA